jgi:hypothetical protein
MSRAAGKTSRGSKLGRVGRLGLTLIAAVLARAVVPLSAQIGVGRIVSEHIWVRMPVDREWLGRETIVQLEQVWRYVSAMTSDALPRRLLVAIDWDTLDAHVDLANGSISIGLASPAAQAAPKRFLLHGAAREMALFGLAQVSRGGALRPEARSLSEAMAEVMAHEQDRSVKALAGAWTLAHLLDRIRPLSIARLGEWSEDGGESRFRAVAPAITFMTSCLELHGRDRGIKLFEALRKGSVEEALSAAFRARPEVLEEEWLRKVRALGAFEDLTVAAEEDAPVLRQTVAPPARPGAVLQLRFAVEDAMRDLTPGSVFVVDEASRRVFQAQREGAGTTARIDIPIEAGRAGGKYTYRAVAVDDAGNVRQWVGSYTVVP